MLFLLILVLIILVEGILITLSLIKLDNIHLKKFYDSLQPKYKKNIRYYILISVFNEASIIEETYQHFEKLVSQYNNIKCIFITTEKENKILGENRTEEILKRCISNDNRFLIVHYPYTEGNKPSQLNYCLEKFKEQFYSLNQDVYICQYDADSRPDIMTFEEITNIVAKTNARVIQQQTKYNQNYKRLGIYMRLEAVFQTRWAYGFERRNQFLSINKKINNIFMPYAYCVGHGMIVESQLLYEIGLYPTPSEDVPFGFKMMLIKEPIYPSVLNDIGSVTLNFIDLINQSGNWVKAPLLAVKMYKEVKSIKDVSLYRIILFYSKVCADFFSWIQYFVFTLIIVVMSVNMHFIRFIFIGYLLLFVEAAPGIYYTHKYIFEEENLRERIVLMIISPLRSVVRGLSIFSFINQSVFGWYYDRGRKE
jgi:hypothetical protein